MRECDIGMMSLTSIESLSKFSESSLRTQGPIASESVRLRRPVDSLVTRRMGPCVRRDDPECRDDGE